MYQRKENGKKKTRLPEMHTTVELIIVILAANCLFIKNPLVNKPMKCASTATKLRNEPSASEFSAKEYNICPSKGKDKSQAKNSEKPMVEYFL